MLEAAVPLDELLGELLAQPFALGLFLEGGELALGEVEAAEHEPLLGRLHEPRVAAELVGDLLAGGLVPARQRQGRLDAALVLETEEFGFDPTLPEDRGLHVS